LKNLLFAQAVEPDNVAVAAKLLWAKEQRAVGALMLFSAGNAVGSRQALRIYRSCGRPPILKDLIALATLKDAFGCLQPLP